MRIYQHLLTSNQQTKLDSERENCFVNGLILLISFSANFRLCYFKHFDWLKIFDHPISGQPYKASMIVNYNSRVVIWGIFKSGTTLES